MGMIQVRFEDPASSITLYGLWDDDEVPSAVTILASLQDAFRAREGAPLVHAGWHRALEACRAAEASLPGRPLAERHAAAREAFLAGGPLAPDASAVAALLLAYDAHYYRPYPDPGQAPDDEHGIGGRPHVVVSVSHADHGHGPETVLTIRVARDEWIREMFDRPLEPDDELGARWVGRADLALARRIRALNPFEAGLTRLVHEPGEPPVAETRLDAATVAVAHARILGMPLPVALELHGTGLHPSPPAEDAPALPRGEGRLVVRFHRAADPDHGVPAATVILERLGDARDLPDVLARIAATPLLPVALEATADRVSTAPLAFAESFAARHEHPGERVAWGMVREPDVAVRMREVERYLYPHGGLNPRGVPQGYASLLFAAEPGLWRVRPDGAADAVPDVTVDLARVLPPNMAGGYVMHGSGDPPARADGAPTNATTLMRVAPAERHAASVAADPVLHAHGRVLSAWVDALAPLRVEGFGFDPAACAFTVNFEETCLAACYARLAGLELPDATPFGPIPRTGAYRWRRELPHVPDWEPEALLAPAELDLQRRARADLAERESARGGGSPA